jgi:hypothetical protein
MSEPETLEPKRKRWWHHLWAFLAAIAAVITVLERISDVPGRLLPAPAQVWLPLIFFIGAGLLLNGGAGARAVYWLLVRFTPLGVAFTLALIVLLVYQIRPHGIRPVPIKFDPTRGALFNSWNLPPEVPLQLAKRIRAYGSNTPGQELMWVFDADSGRFTFGVNTKVEQNDKNASSGGYMTFYDTPCRKTDYNHLAFDCRITETAQCSDPDVGVRLAVDGQGRELATYEIRSLVGYFTGKYTPDGNWKHFDVYIPDLKQVWITSGPTPGIDQNTLNKVAFFVNDTTSRRCSKGTIWIKNVAMLP